MEPMSIIRLASYKDGIYARDAYRDSLALKTGAHASFTEVCYTSGLLDTDGIAGIGYGKGDLAIEPFK